MLLKSLELHGFKSFPDKITLRFGNGITAVVGPNGSGKSNISDAVRWVLGEQSTKSLRGAKMEDVIFSGTSSRRAQGFAEVTLVIDNSDRRLSLDTDEVAVTRRYYRSGESEYQLNRATVRLKDIHELFMDTGLGRDGYSIIGQGRIADIVSSRSEDRREIFEEAAGISKFRYRKEEASRRLDKAEENLVRLRDILAELEAQIGPLAEQSEKAQKFLVLAAEKETLEIGLWLHALERSKNALREQERKIAVANGQYEDLARHLTDIEAEVERVYEQTQKITVQIDEIRRSAETREEQAARAESDAAVLENTIFHNGNMLEKLGQDLEAIRGAGRSIETEIARRRENIKSTKQRAEEKKDEFFALQASLSSLTEESGEHTKRLDELRRRSNELTAKAANARVEAVGAETALSQLRQRGGSVDAALAEKQDYIEKLTGETEAAKADLRETEETLLALSNTIKGYAMRVSSREEKAAGARAAAEKLSLSVREKQSRISVLTRMEQNLEGFAHSVKAVMQASEAGRLGGIHGPVSRLITTEKKYAAAIEIALGAAMQNIVVSSEGDAKRAIGFLKTAGVGRATFLPVTTIRGRTLNERGLSDCFGFVGVASDLVSFDPQYREIAQSLLGRTVVAEELDSAVNIARQYGYRFRVVTLDGQVVNAGGSLTGGSMAKSAGLLSRAAEIDGLKAQCAKTEEEHRRALQALKAAEEELSSAKADSLGAEGEYATAGEDKIRLEAELRRLSQLVSAAENDISGLEAERADSKGRMDALTARLQAAKELEEKLLAEVQACDGEIDSLTGEGARLSEKREALLEALSAARAEIASLEQEIESEEKAVEELGVRGESEEARVAGVQQEISRIEAENEAARGKIAELRESAEALRQSGRQSEARISGLRGEQASLEEKSRSLRALEKEKSCEREKLSGELARLTEQRAAMHKDYDDVQKKLYDEYGLTRHEAEQKGIVIEEPQKAQRRLTELKNQIRALGSVNVAAIDQYKEVSERYEFMSTQISDVENSRDELLRIIRDLTLNMKKLFEERFAAINSQFGVIFRDLFGGGSAELRLADPSDVLESGIDMLIQPPGKNVQNIDLFSGGEKALTAIALYFAILRVSPSPFCILDEIEAALDDVNVDRFAGYRRRMCGATQFIAITHRRGTMEEADMLYGVTMQEEGVSKLLSLNASEVSSRLGLK